MIALLAVAGAFQSYRLTALALESEPDQFALALSETRFAALKGKLPPNVRCGYLTDLPPGSYQESLAFRAAQYTLAPAFLVSLSPNVKVDWVVGNFSQPQDFAALGAAQGLDLVQDLGQGVVLYRVRKAGQ